MTPKEFSLLATVEPRIRVDSKSHEAARRVLVLGEEQSRVAKDLELSRGNVWDVCNRYLKVYQRMKLWTNR